MQWNPKKTWVVYASMVEGHFDPTGRRDHELVAALLEAGVPKGHVFFLPDANATAASVVDAISSVGKQAGSHDMLVFIFSGHGALEETDRGWTNRYVVEGEQPLTSRQVLDAIEASFGGALAVLVADNCMSGATVNDVIEHDGDVPMAALSSTAAFDVSWTGWLLIAQLLWLVQGAPWLDVDGDGEISLEDFFRFVEEELALVRGFKPSWCIRDDIELTFHRNVRTRSHERMYERVHAEHDGSRAAARILSVAEGGQTAEVQWLDRYGAATGQVPLDECIPLTFDEHEVGALVRVNEQSDQASAKGAKGVVKKTFRGLHLVRFDEGDESDIEALYDWIPFQQLTPRR